MADFTVINHMPEIAAALHEAAAEAAKKTAEGIVTDYSANAPRRSGFMASSAYVVTHDSSTYGNTTGSGSLLPQVDTPSDDQEAIAAVGAEYAGAVEYGTSRMAAQPAFHPALDGAEAVLVGLLEALETVIALKVKGV